MDSPTLLSILIDLVDPSPFQIRKRFESGRIRSLADSLAKDKLSTPILVRPLALASTQLPSSGPAIGCRYQLVSGECRVRAAKLLGWTQILARVEELTDAQVLIRGVLENENQTATTIIEKARGYRAMMSPPANLSQEEVARIVGLDQSVISRRLAFLEQPEEIQSLLESDRLSEWQVRSLIRIKNLKKRISVAKRIAKKEQSARRAVGQLNSGERPSRRTGKAKLEASAEYGGFRFAWKDAEEVSIVCRNFRRSRDIPRQFGQDLENALDAFFRQVAPPGESAPIAQYPEAPAADFEQLLSPPEGHAESASASSCPKSPAESTPLATPLGILHQ